MVESVVEQMQSLAGKLDIVAFHNKASLLNRPLKELHLCEALCRDINTLMNIDPEADGSQTAQEQSMLSWCCNKFGLELPQDFYNNLACNEIIEVFDLTGKTLYKNLFYFQFSGYSIEEHATLSFFELFSRPKENEIQIMRLLEALVAKRDFRLKKSPLPVHLLRESKTKGKSVFGIDVQCVQLVKDIDTGMACAVAVRTRVKEYPMGLI